MWIHAHVSSGRATEVMSGRTRVLVCVMKEDIHAAALYY